MPDIIGDLAACPAALDLRGGIRVGGCRVIPVSAVTEFPSSGWLSVT
jgi:hypothetical protein